MRALDAAAIDGLGIPGAVLMERAGLAAAHEILQRHPPPARGDRCGPGNNGGDGFVVARHLRRRGLEVRGCWSARPRGWSANRAPTSTVAERLGVPVVRRPQAAVLRRALRRADVVVDALFGTGFRGAIRNEPVRA